MLAILGEEGFIPPQIQEISFPDGEIPYQIILGALTVNTRCIRGICMTNSDCLTINPEAAWFRAGNRAAFFVHFPVWTLTIR